MNPTAELIAVSITSALIGAMLCEAVILLAIWQVKRATRQYRDVEARRVHHILRPHPTLAAAAATIAALHKH